MKLLKSVTYALAGIISAFASEVNFKIHILAAVIATALGIVLHIAHTEWLVIILCIAFVLAMEMINTAIEQLCNVANKETHPAIKKIKDIAAGAVLVAAMGSLIIGGIIFLPKIIVYLKIF
jgi:diacylglycerol kinase